jgi:hypothetical protein
MPCLEPSDYGLLDWSTTQYHGSALLLLSTALYVVMLASTAGAVWSYLRLSVLPIAKASLRIYLVMMVPLFAAFGSVQTQLTSAHHQEHIHLLALLLVGGAFVVAHARRLLGWLRRRRSPVAC